ncbi:MAG: hypothetical protein QG625_141 [Cyanobacteriota bacterium erpe_2018_sw_39hr_WHONDRS-SW48-000098_B_bin.30]|nr:hypothetical protein [Cyanobacteriota bacterium erpe_2018_sw_39hr_WHONDRS-SW48-000098_B_bin.30]
MSWLHCYCAYSILLLVFCLCTFDVPGAFAMPSKQTLDDGYQRLVCKLAEIEDAQKEGLAKQTPSYPYNTTLSLKRDSYYHVRQACLAKGDWSGFTSACLDMALIERSFKLQGAALFEGYLNQRKFDEAMLVLAEINKTKFDGVLSSYDIRTTASAIRFAMPKNDVQALESITANCLEHRNLECLKLARLASIKCLTAHNQKDAASKISDAFKEKYCPLCCSDNEVIPIAYGLPSGPVGDDVHLGGCIESPNRARWWCRRDKLAF